MSFVTVLVICSDPRLRRTVCRILAVEGYSVKELRPGEDVLTVQKRVRFDFIVVDLDSFAKETCRKLRQFSDAPIIGLSHGDTTKDKMAGLACGVDEYIVKPFVPDELLTRVRSLLRRSGIKESMPSFVSEDGIELVINCERRKITVHGRNVRLSPRLFEVLKCLLANDGRPVTHAQILESVWGPGAASEQAQDNLRVVINQIRKKIETDPAHPKYILTEPWVGYRFETCHDCNPVDVPTTSTARQTVSCGKLRRAARRHLNEVS